MNVILLNFSKKENSTKQPDVTGITPASCTLKDDTSVMNPTLIFSTGFMPTPSINPVGLYNYAKIDNFQRYYYIRDWQYILGRWEAVLECDVLASFKGAIGETSVYIERAASAYNGDIIDSFYPAKTDVNITRISCTSPWLGVAPSGGTYILGCINYQSSNNIGSVSYYAVNASTLASVLNYLFTGNIFTSSNITEIGEGLFKSMFNPFQYIVSCMWFPFASTAFGTTATDIKVGYWSTGINGIMVNSIAEKTYVSGTIPIHPQSATRGAYLNRAPYTRITLYAPPFGEIPVDPNFLAIGNYLYSAVYIDHITGQAVIQVAITEDANHLNDSRIITERNAMIGVPIQLAQVATDYVSSVASGANAIGRLLSLDFLGAASSIVSSIESQMPKVSSNGFNGSFMECILSCGLVVEHYKLVDENLAEFGRPLMTTKQINSLSGYVKCAAPDIELPGFGNEREKIMQFMVNGFFYE